MLDRPLCFVSIVALSACRPDAPERAPRPAPPTIAPSLATASDPFEPLPSELDLDPRAVELGRALFEDPHVSGDGARACVDCHALDQGGIVPHEARSNHPLNETGPYNVPTIFNVAFNFRFNWQGTFPTLEEHVGGPMMNEQVMDAGSWPELVGRLAPLYQDDFVDAGFALGVTEASVRHVIATYERSLLTPDAPFDRYLRGESELTADAAAGYALFKDLGCASCHQGINVGGNMFQRFGVMADAFEGRPIGKTDYGRMLQTGREEDAYVFRVPSLRNVAVTAPYFHDGSTTTLDEAVRRMGRVQLGYALTDEETARLVSFLETLTGELDGVSLARVAP